MSATDLGAWRVTHFAYGPVAERLGLSSDDYPTGVGFLLIADRTGLIRLTRAGTPEAVMKLSLGGYHDGAEALRDFPRFRPGYPHEWVSPEADMWITKDES